MRLACKDRESGAIFHSISSPTLSRSSFEAMPLPLMSQHRLTQLIDWLDRSDLESTAKVVEPRGWTDPDDKSWRWCALRPPKSLPRRWWLVTNTASGPPCSHLSVAFCGGSRPGGLFTIRPPRVTPLLLTRPVDCPNHIFLPLHLLHERQHLAMEHFSGAFVASR